MAASRIDDYLRHRYPLASKETRNNLEGELSAETVEMIRKIGRLEPPVLSREARTSDFKPIELAYDWAAAVEQARRCLRCGVGAEITSQDRCASCLTCLRVCPYHVPRLDASGTIQIPTDQCLACGICVAECPAKVIVLRKPYDRRHIVEELDHALRSAAEAKLQPFIVGFCCQYGLFGTGALAALWRESKAGIWIVPILCIAKVEADHMLRAFELGAEGVFVAGCGTQCARENTAASIQQRVGKVKNTLAQIGLEPERIHAFILKAEENPGKELDEFIAQIGKLYLASTIMQEVRR
jgi:coenzyme F420-reducing hydrogenase delta subunit/NAD-dependent dihydropyrimidine dehydrogenase PreA subunit